jgi:magnesium chelatase family protein
VDSYLDRISGPILDRIDMHVEVPALPFDDLSKKEASEPSAKIRERINRARALQRARGGDSGVSCNARLTPSLMREHCALSPECAQLMKSAFDRLGLTARSYDRILRVARTIADLSGGKDISPVHLAEAIQFRTLDLRRR